ncbi:HEPN domain-containing protein [Magnetofaba australis]|uniref:Putative HEPN domain-containing protein n=1 Tax=Magnetofaba australis IT-1 TaxID=1434232 RepID=A0A1Y2K8G9_9PROT|nr:HEPN domain-containing protein [Magnetofaba australis]OSM06736.1 putative HEPN domain-containing protein [Magnetofaba australis IT-1]
MNVQRQIDHWRTGSDEDLEAAEIMITAGKRRHGLFFLHLSVEKILKAHVWRVTQEHPPKIHNLLRLVQIAALSLGQEQSALLVKLNRHCLEGRYAEEVAATPDAAETEILLQQAKEVQTWLRNQL